MNAPRRTRVVITVVLLLLMVGGIGLVVRDAFFKKVTISAFFTTATGIYPGDEVRVAGVKVGRIDTIEPVGTQAKMTLIIDKDVPIPADAKAVIVAQNLVSARYVQLAPSYQDSGPTMSSGAVIPVDRTAVPVEWDEVKDQLTRLAGDLGPSGEISSTSVGRFIDSAADAMEGNGDKLRQTVAQLSKVGKVLADGGTNIADIITNLAAFAGALRDSNIQIFQFQDHLATLTSVIDDSSSALDATLNDLSKAVNDVREFIAQSRDQTAEQIQRLGNVTQNLVDHQKQLEQVLHVMPNAFANFYNIYNPNTGSEVGAFTLSNFANPVEFVCSMIGALENATAADSARLCAQYLGPALRLLSFNDLPVPINPLLMPSATPDQIIYSEDRLKPGGVGPKPGPPDTPPTVSAYTGQPGDPQAPPPPSTNSTGIHSGGTAPPQSDQQPRTSPANLPDMLLPAEGPRP